MAAIRPSYIATAVLLGLAPVLVLAERFHVYASRVNEALFYADYETYPGASFSVYSSLAAKSVIPIYNQYPAGNALTLIVPDNDAFESFVVARGGNSSDPQTLWTDEWREHFGGLLPYLCASSKDRWGLGLTARPSSRSGKLVAGQLDCGDRLARHGDEVEDRGLEPSYRLAFRSATGACRARSACRPCRQQHSGCCARLQRHRLQRAVSAAACRSELPEADLELPQTDSATSASLTCRQGHTRPTSSCRSSTSCR